MGYFYGFHTGCFRVQVCVGSGAMFHEIGLCCSSVELLKLQPCLDASDSGVLVRCVNIALLKHHMWPIRQSWFRL